MVGQWENDWNIDWNKIAVQQQYSCETPVTSYDYWQCNNSYKSRYTNWQDWLLLFQNERLNLLDDLFLYGEDCEDIFFDEDYLYQKRIDMIILLYIQHLFYDKSIHITHSRFRKLQHLQKKIYKKILMK
jgi:hypothetical protein